MPSDDEQPHDSIRKRDVDPTDSKRLQLYWYSQKHSKATQKELTLWFYTIQETNQLQLSSSEIHITRRLLNHSFTATKGFRLRIIGVLNGIDDSIGGLSSGIRGLGSGIGGLGGGNW